MAGQKLSLSGLASLVLHWSRETNVANKKVTLIA